MGLWDTVPAPWRGELADQAEAFDRLEVLLQQERAAHMVLPEPGRVLRALEVPPEGVRVLIVGQDPYPNPAHACGLAFSVPAGTRPLPASLRNILAEVRSDVGQSIAESGDLQPWVDQGVLLLNRNLTVVAGAPMSHARVGWRVVTDAIVSAVARRSPAVVAALWGAQAQQVGGLLPAGSVVAAAHPSPLSAHRGFLGTRPFSAVNALLAERHMPPIRW